MLIDVQAHGNLMEFTHVQDVAPIINDVARIREETDRGFTRERTMQHVGSIPYYVWMNLTKINPAMKDPKELEKWLYSDEGEPYRIASKTHVSGSGIQIMVK